METNTEAYFRHDPMKESTWTRTILESINGGSDAYYKVESKQLVTMLIIVIAKKVHRAAISEVQCTSAGVGLMNVMGNKGGVSVRFRLHDSYVCFVTSHLAAFADKTEKRNQDFIELSKRLIYPNHPDPLTEYVSYSWNNGGDEGVSFMENNQAVHDWDKESSIFHNDVLIWCGDLNYRVNLNEAVIKNYVSQNKLTFLLDYDQLSIERDAGRTFPMFDEGEIEFPPTYKYDAGTNQYDTSEKRRAPSWTDRVLFKKSPVDSTRPSVELLSYKNCMTMMNSDHKPVRALFRMNIRKIDSRKQHETRQRLIQQIVDNPDTQPRGDISSSFIDFEKVRFMEYKEKNILLENTGQVLMLFKFISSGEEDVVFPPWLQVEPSSGVLAPGEKVVLRFEVTVDPTISAPLNRGEQSIEDILILRLADCKDFFISINGDYIPTCFGVPLEQLSELTVPILQVTNTAYKPMPVLNQIDVPKELWMLMNFLWSPTMFSMEPLFLEHGDLVVSTYIRDCLDNGTQFDGNVLLGGSSPTGVEGEGEQLATSMEHLNLTEEEKRRKEIVSANSMIDVLVAFLECLPEPVISTHLYERALDAGDSSDAMNILKESLAPFHRNVLLYIGIFLRQAIDAAPANCRNAREEKIIETFTVLLRPPLDFKERNPAVAKERREKFVVQLLKTCKT
ncbi:Endonuclease/exonuclease/phosphatase [Mucor mucedo]|uniref:Endonuclease/exonuclease/phosphatase n=1 Tax=Mucor mucedo TaxID=29922 RepID=UPI00221FFF1B|nr:Endonuclease/exonuclease/phosphatase [Mucor mucedo]KAI7888825.1 Endonuclease/exonuclease/phosphatase [Mucor mucedo]